MPDEYDYGVVHGSLKLKKPKGLFKKTTKKLRKPKSKKQPAKTDNASSIAKTEAEKRFDDMKKKRKLEHIERLAEKSFGDRVKEFNEKLERTPEHNDVPKVGPG
ncbi:hypothetical protein IW140_002187 [Coemansia sp. RSA 1813]|nr:hypothetical protein EV178_001337 [Coemansia sp. RSA 1646]KAJ1770214.1 hypothetical protein LPJ74_003359 [Coemansia sp. RSA 1843]KAJ2090171.1 hypothetical protein IW138_002803 [Coemansia sp. RSA 986]KAJ2214578.1 hypothetical protein EV179_002837 [Coemansia sp. RSA 487]KAJ2570761.1 hypothetical protein IW140_002187 [Coemansia sp. RSA 1813]